MRKDGDNRPSVSKPKEVQNMDDLEHMFVPSSMMNRRRRRRPQDKTAIQATSVKKVQKKELPVAEPILEGETDRVDCVEMEQSMDLSVVYASLLLQFEGISPCCKLGLAYAMQDFDKDLRKLNNVYFIVRRRPLKCIDGYISLYTCQCNVEREAVVFALERSTNCSVKAMEELNCQESMKECIHVQTFRKVMHANVFIDDEAAFGMDYKETAKQDHPYGQPQDRVHLYGISSNDLAVSVNIENKDSFGIVEIQFKNTPAMFCMSCGKQACVHTAAIRNCPDHPLAKRFKELLDIEPTFRHRYVPFCISKAPIDFQFFGNAKEIPSDSLFPAPCGMCECGNPWGDTVNPQEAIFVSPTTTSFVTVYDRQCCKCNRTKSYDGGEHDLLNMGNYLISHDVFREYTKLFLTDGTTLSSYYKILVWKHMERGNSMFEKELSYYRFRHAWYAYLKLMNIDYKSGFCCPTCGPAPDTIIMDGVTLGIQKSHFTRYFDPEVQSKNLDGSFSARVFIKNQRCRRLLKMYASKGVSTAEFEELHGLIKSYSPPLVPLFVDFFQNDHTKTCPKMFSSFLCSLSSDYPLSALVHSDPLVLKILDEEAKGGNFRGNISNMLALEQNVPSLFTLLTKFNETPASVRLILSSVVENVHQLLTFPQHKLRASSSSSSSCVDYFPSLPCLCVRGSYVLDDVKGDATTGCTKKHGTHPSLTSGLFTMSCQHGVCYGFSLMSDAESPNTPFTLLRTRFKQAPKCVIYDNACNLHKYCINRDPGFFKDTWFLVDRFHWPNHKGCHSGYSISTYRKLDSINSQVAEQRNATLKNLRSMLSYMNQDNFMNHCKIFMWFRSKLSIFRHNKVHNCQYKNLFLNLIKVYTK